MSYSFQCPACQATVSGTSFLAGRRVRCPECDALVQAESAEKGTVTLVPSQDDKENTVILEAIEVSEAVEPVEVTETAGPPVAGSSPTVSERPPTSESPRSAQLGDADGPPLRRMSPKHRMAGTEMDMTPMVDVTFLLLIFFMVTATFTLQKSLEIPKSAEEDPSTAVSEEIPDDPADFVTVMVDEYNTYQVITVDWEREAPSDQDLYIMLREARGGDSLGTVPTKLRVEAHGDALHEKVVAAIDAGTANGFDEVQLASMEDDE